MQINVYEFILIYDRETYKTKSFCFEKRASPFSPGTRECVCLVPKNWDTDACNLRHRLIRFHFCTRTPSKIQDLYESISMPWPTTLAYLGTNKKSPRGAKNTKDTIRKKLFLKVFACLFSNQRNHSLRSILTALPFFLPLLGFIMNWYILICNEKVILHIQLNIYEFIYTNSYSFSYTINIYKFIDRNLYIQNCIKKWIYILN